ncbi:MAG: hypothetical protein IKR04_06490 [Clostridia bacterium]|nr:hypothetical protein [Clostridia bacterium]
MKNLLDELHNLDEEDFEVSKDFSKRIITKINKDKKITLFSRVTSLVAVACVAALAVFVGSKFGFLDRVNSLVSNSSSQMAEERTPATGIETQVEDEQPMVQKQLQKNDVFDEYRAFEESVTEESAFSDNVVTASKTYSKQMSLDDYIRDIKQALDENSIEYEVISNTEIEVYTSDMESLYGIIDNYPDVQLELIEDRTLLRIGQN